MDGGGGHWLLVQMEWRPAGWSLCLPLLISPCTIKSRTSLLAPAHPGGPGKRAVKRLWCGIIIYCHVSIIRIIVIESRSHMRCVVHNIILFVWIRCNCRRMSFAVQNSSIVLSSACSTTRGPKLRILRRAMMNLTFNCCHKSVSMTCCSVFHCSMSV